MSTPASRQPREVEIHHPNRGKPAVLAIRAVVIVLLLITIALLVVITIAGWPALEGAKPEQIGLIIVYALLTLFAVLWRRGILPLAAALGIIMAIFALVSANGWFSRDKSGFTQPHLSANLLGLLTLLIIPVQLLLIGFATRAFRQGWNVEEERPVGGGPGRDPAAGWPAAA